jgi:hypothetical protein
VCVCVCVCVCVSVCMCEMHVGGLPQAIIEVNFLRDPFPSCCAYSPWAFFGMVGVVGRSGKF